MKSLNLHHAVNPIVATIAIPGSKSYTNRALIMAALAEGETTLTECSPSQDCHALISALRLLGVVVEIPDETTIVVTGTDRGLRPYQGTIDVGPAGTTMRFLTALCCGIPGADIVLQGSERMHVRPIKALVESLRQAGATIDYLGREGCPPLRVRPSQSIDASALRIDGTTSSQFVSALLLASPLFTGPFELSIIGKQTSTSYLDMTLQGMRDFGISVACEQYKTIRIPTGQRYRAQTYKIEGDASGASYLWAVAAVSGGSVTVENINPHSAQGDILFPAGNVL